MQQVSDSLVNHVLSCNYILLPEECSTTCNYSKTNDCICPQTGIDGRTVLHKVGDLN